jgi:nitrite reductase/ring-hydroxylating ferredoxin subunit
MSIAHRLATRVEQLKALDAVSAPIKSAVGRAVAPQAVRNTLSGSSLGHPVHPVLKDVPIGAWTMSVVLDAVGGPLAAPAADRLLGVGIAAAVPTAAAGLNDWSDTTGVDTRVGLVHATANVGALSLFTASLVARRSGHRSRGKALSAVGFGLLSFGGFLGGHLVFARGVNVNRTAFERRPRAWKAVLADDQLADGEGRTVLAGSAPVLLYREGGTPFAIANTCSHAGGPLGDGRIADGCVTCPWHGSTFRINDGSIVRGPASAPQPTYEVRVSEGQIEVRAR